MSLNKTKQLRKATLPYQIMLGLSATAVAATPVFAQTDTDAAADEVEEEAVLEEVIVTGMRGSLMSAQTMRQTSDVIVDAVTADDMSALPDRVTAMFIPLTGESSST